MRRECSAETPLLSLEMLLPHQDWATPAVGGGKLVFLLSRGRLRTLQLWASPTAIMFVLHSPVSLDFYEILYRQCTVFHSPPGKMTGTFQIFSFPQLLLVFDAFQRCGGNYFPTPLPGWYKFLGVHVQLLLGLYSFFQFLAASLKGNKRDLLVHWAVEINPLKHYGRRRKIIN